MRSTVINRVCFLGISLHLTISLLLSSSSFANGRIPEVLTREFFAHWLERTVAGAEFARCMTGKSRLLDAAANREEVLESLKRLPPSEVEGVIGPRVAQMEAEFARQNNGRRKPATWMAEGPETRLLEALSSEFWKPAQAAGGRNFFQLRFDGAAPNYEIARRSFDSYANRDWNPRLSTEIDRLEKVIPKLERTVLEIGEMSHVATSPELLHRYASEIGEAAWHFGRILELSGGQMTPGEFQTVRSAIRGLKDLTYSPRWFGNLPLEAPRADISAITGAWERIYRLWPRLRQVRALER